MRTSLFFRHCLVCSVACTASLFFSGMYGRANAQPTITSKVVAQANRIGVVNQQQRVPLQGHVPVWAARTELAAVPVDPSEAVRMTLVLRRSDAAEAAFQKLLLDQQTPGSPMFHHAVSPEQQGELYGPTTHDIQAIKRWAEAEGLTVRSVSPSRTAVELSGTVTTVESALEVHFSMYRTLESMRRAPDSEPKIPSAMADVVDAVAGLTVEHAHPDVATPANQAERLDPLFTSGKGNHYITPADFATIYNVNPVYGSGNSGANIGSKAQRVAIVATSDANPTDVQAFFAGIGRQNVTYNVVLADGVAPGYTTGQSEAELDLERVLGTAPGVTVDLVEGVTASGLSPAYNAAAYAVNTLQDQIVTVSFGECETSLGGANARRWQNLWATAAANMTSVFVSGGDSGAAACDTHGSAPPAMQSRAINGFCTSVSNTCVGGTQFNDGGNPSQYWASTNTQPTKASALSYIPEGVWNEPTRTDSSGNVSYVILAGDGGASQFVTKPAWQAGPGVPVDGQRDTPDISFSASVQHTPYYFCGPDECDVNTQGLPGQFVAYGNGGTSASAPSMAGIAALLNTAAGSPQGNLNSTIYRLANSSVANMVFHDVTVASSGVTNCDVNTPSLCNNSTPSPNSLTGGQVGFVVGDGYDQASGWGSLNVANFLRAAVAVNTSLSLTLTGTNVGVGQVLSATATLTPAATSLAAPSGTVQFLVNGAATGSPVTLSDTSANSAPISFPAASSYTITAVYSGDALYAPSTTAGSAVSVAAQPPALTLTATPQTLTFTSGATSGNTAMVSTTGSNNFAGEVNFSCAISASNAAFQPTCSVTPGTATLTSNGTASVSVTVNSTTAQARLDLLPYIAYPLRAKALVTIAGLLMLGFTFGRHRRVGSLLALIILTAGMAGCSGTSKPRSLSEGSYDMTVTVMGTGTGAIAASSTTTTIKVTIQ